MSNWFLWRNNMPLGPYSEEQLLQWIATGHVAPTDRVLRAGETVWQLAQAIAESGAASQGRAASPVQASAIVPSNSVYAEAAPNPTITPAAPAGDAPAVGAVDNNSGMRTPAPLEVTKMGFSWGAFGLTWVWGGTNRVWIALLTLAFVGLKFIPGVPPGGLLGLANFAFCIWLGEKGHELAWRNRRFQGFEEYRQTMRVWNKWGIASFIVQCLMAVLYFVALVNGKQH